MGLSRWSRPLKRFAPTAINGNRSMRSLRIATCVLASRVGAESASAKRRGIGDLGIPNTKPRTTPSVGSELGNGSASTAELCSSTGMRVRFAVLSAAVSASSSSGSDCADRATDDGRWSCDLLNREHEGPAGQWRRCELQRDHRSPPSAHAAQARAAGVRSPRRGTSPRAAGGARFQRRSRS